MALFQGEVMAAALLNNGGPIKPHGTPWPPRGAYATPRGPEKRKHSGQPSPKKFNFFLLFLFICFKNKQCEQNSAHIAAHNVAGM